MKSKLISINSDRRIVHLNSQNLSMYNKEIKQLMELALPRLEQHLSKELSFSLLSYSMLVSTLCQNTSFKQHKDYFLLQLEKNRVIGYGHASIECDREMDNELIGVINIVARHPEYRGGKSVIRALLPKCIECLVQHPIVAIKTWAKKSNTHSIARTEEMFNKLDGTVIRNKQLSKYTEDLGDSQLFSFDIL